MTDDKECQKVKKELLSKSKDKGLDLWEKVFKKYGIDIEKAKTTGVYIKEMGGYITLYFDEEKDQWLYKKSCLKMS